jgi:hypothetical protein
MFVSGRANTKAVCRALHVVNEELRKCRIHVYYAPYALRRAAIATCASAHTDVKISDPEQPLGMLPLRTVPRRSLSPRASASQAPSSPIFDFATLPPAFDFESTHSRRTRPGAIAEKRSTWTLSDELFHSHFLLHVNRYTQILLDWQTTAARAEAITGSPSKSVLSRARTMRLRLLVKLLSWCCPLWRSTLNRSCQLFSVTIRFVFQLHVFLVVIHVLLVLCFRTRRCPENGIQAFFGRDDSILHRELSICILCLLRLFLMIISCCCCC